MKVGSTYPIGIGIGIGCYYIHIYINIFKHILIGFLCNFLDIQNLLIMICIIYLLSALILHIY